MIKIQEKEHILSLLKKTEQAIKEDNIYLLRELSNQTVHSASIYQDTDNIVIAVIIFSLSKILERRDYRDNPNWKDFIASFKIHLKKSIQGLEKDDLDKFRFEIKKIRRDIEDLSGVFKKHIEEVFKKAEISKASRIYEHGISMEQTAKLLGISIWELAEYSGQTGISDVNFNVTLPVKKRIQTAMEFIG